MEKWPNPQKGRKTTSHKGRRSFSTRFGFSWRIFFNRWELLTLACAGIPYTRSATCMSGTAVWRRSVRTTTSIIVTAVVTAAGAGFEIDVLGHRADVLTRSIHTNPTDRELSRRAKVEVHTGSGGRRTALVDRIIGRPGNTARTTGPAAVPNTLISNHIVMRGTHCHTASREG